MGEKKRRDTIAITTTRHIETHCLNCGGKVDASSGFAFGEPVRPREGDVTVCLKCRHVMAFNADLSLRNLTETEIVDLAGDRRLVALVNLLGAYQQEQDLERRCRTDGPQAGDEETRRQIHREAGRAAVDYLQAARRETAGS